MHSPFASLRSRGAARAAVLLASVGLVLASWSGVPAPVAARARLGQAADQPSTSAQAFHLSMRKLWEDHITWTRLYIVSALADLPDLKPTTDRLLQNQVDIGNAIRPFYGDAAGDQLTSLLTDHILIAADVVAAARSGDSASLQSNMTRWQANADQIGDFLGAANPDNWSATDMKAMMRQHLDLTTAEVVARLKGDWPSDIVAYDRVHAHILMLADQLADGIVAQFPDAFAG